MKHYLGFIFCITFCLSAFPNIASAKSCKVRPASIQYCSDKVVCEWQRYNRFVIREAKKRGLSCAIKEVSKAKKIIKPASKLKVAFNILDRSQRLYIQRSLKSLGFYNSTIDGIYGPKTAAALTGYNKQNLNGANLNIQNNVNSLLLSILRPPKKPKATEAPKPKPAQVQPENTDDKTYNVASGTGFYVSDEGHIITNHHVINGCKEMKVQSKGRVFSTLRIADDTRNDLALLKISETPSHVFPLSQNSPYSLQEIIVAGFPFGEQISSTLKFTQGIVSAVAGPGNDYSQIQIDAAIQPGNSGGPIMDEFGNVIGVAVAKLSLEKIFKDYGVVPENTNFGVKASAIKNLMEGNGIEFKTPNEMALSKKDLSTMATNGTVHLTCWMTRGQIDQMKTKKLMFETIK